ncbi:MAG: pyridoxamine 5'-phosphate oxidase family protein [Actinomycetota bacterium]
MTTLLPLSPSPFVLPEDRDMLPSERREFVRSHRTCIFGYSRRSDGPAMSVVYYVPTTDDELLIATMAGRAKAKAVTRSGKVSLCVLNEHWPVGYLQVYCDAVVDRDRNSTVDVMMAVGGRMSGTEVDPAARPLVEAMADEEDRILLRCRPYATFATPPRHLHDNDDTSNMTHWISGSVAWDATDPA